jgi:hypothetical protein
LGIKETDMKNNVTVYWNEGGYYLEPTPEIRYNTEASMFRMADTLGYTHVKIVHGRYKIGEGFISNNVISPCIKRIPKKYRKES